MQVDPTTLAVPAPTPTADSAPFWQGCSEGHLSLQRCESCERWVFYPRALCPFCWSSQLRWQQASGIGTVRSFTVIHKPGHPAWAVAAPYTVAVISLAEGPTMLTTVIDIDPDSVRVGLPVEVAFTRVGDFTLTFFRPGSDEVAANTSEVVR